MNGCGHPEARAGKAAVLASAGLLALPAPLFAHGEAIGPDELWGAWTLEPGIVLPLLLGAWLYARGVRRLWRRAGFGRGVRPWRAGAFAGGLFALLVALVSPLDALGEALFSAHMAQHLVLMLVAAPLLVLGVPPRAVAWAVPPGVRRGVARAGRRFPGLHATMAVLTHPVAAWCLAAAVTWAWHAPALYDAAIANDFIHALEHASFLAAGLLFWWGVLAPAGRMRRNAGPGLLYVFAAAMQNGILGALITFSSAPWYHAHLETTGAWGQIGRAHV